MKLTYFDSRGRVEPIRLMLEMTGTSYDFVAVPAELWPTAQGKSHFEKITPFGQLPVLEHDGFVLAQSGAIRRYVASTIGLSGVSPQQDARADEVTETALDLTLEIGASFWRADFIERRDEYRTQARTRLDAIARYFERMRADPTHWVCSDRYTVGDIYMASAIEAVLGGHPGLVESFPALDRFTRELFSSPGIAEYVRGPRRPRTWTVPLAPYGGRPEETYQWLD